MTNEQLLLAAISALATVVGVLWYRVDQARLKCEADRDALWKALNHALSKPNCKNSHRDDADLTPETGGT